MKPKLIAIDGPDGAGKTTIISMLKEEFPDKAVYTREPGGTPKAEEVRRIVLEETGEKLSSQAEMLLFWGARDIHIDTIIRPALADGKNVVTDRFDASSFAFQVVAEETGELRELFCSVRKAVLGDLEPLYIFLDIDAKTGAERLRRAKGSHMSRFDKMDAEFRERARGGFHRFAEEFPNCSIIDASRPVEEVYRELKRIVSFT